MIPYKQISENLTTNEFNGIVSLLRNNVNFNENIRIRNSTVAGEFGSYQFNFNDATIVDNGVLITNETLSTIGTVKLVNPVFPNSNYFIDLKVYSTEEIHIGDFGDNDEGIIVTELTVPLKKDVEVNIPFETLNMNNIVGFDATVRIDHKDLVIKGLDKIILETNKSKYGYKEEIQLTALYTDDNGSPIEGKEVVFKVNDRYLDTVTTNSEGRANLTCVYENKGNYIFNAQCNNIISNICETEVIVETLQANFVNRNQFNLQGNRLITFTGVLKVDWGDGTIEEFTSFDNMVHTYSSVGNYSVKYTGYITEFRDIFNDKELSSVSIPNTVTKINNNAFYKTKINSVTLPSSVIELGYSAFSLSLLTDITLSENLKIIGESAFANCTSLNSIDIPKSVINMDNRCFYKSVKHMYLNWETSDEILQYNSHWDGYGQIEKFHIPAQTKDLYILKGYPASKLQEPFDNFTFTERTGKQILSQADGDKAYLDVQLTSEGSPVAVEGVDVEFYKDSTLIDTVQTDSTGKASYEYTSVGAGDIVFEAKTSSLVSKRYAIQDIYLYDELTSAKHTWTETIGDTVWSFTNNGLDTKGTSGGCLLKLDETLPSVPYSIELDVTGLTGMQTTYQGRTYTLYGGIATRYTIFEPDNQRTNYNSSSTSNYNSNVLLHTNDKIKAVVESNKVTYYINDVLVGTVNNQNQIYNGELFIRNIGTTGIVLKNLKVRKL